MRGLAKRSPKSRVPGDSPGTRNGPSLSQRCRYGTTVRLAAQADWPPALSVTRCVIWNVPVVR
jgi:hypothetical protein